MIFTLSVDGAFAMVMQDVITQVKYNLPVINVVFSNKSLGFVEAIQEDAGQPLFGVDLEGVDFAKAAEAMGAKGYTVTKAGQLPKIFAAAKRSKVPVVIDVKVGDRRPFPAEAFALDPKTHSFSTTSARCRGRGALRSAASTAPRTCRSTSFSAALYGTISVNDVSFTVPRDTSLDCSRYDGVFGAKHGH